MENVMTMTKPFKSKTFLLVSLIIHLQSTCCTEMPSDDCGLKTCPEGQICVEASADSKSSCACAQGYQGSACDQDINECSAGWTGKDCSENIDDCVTAASAHGSTCHDRVASYICECPPGRTGLLCHIIDSCITNPCPQSSHCLTNPINGEAVCNCHAGYVGPHCNIDVDECDHHNPCEHGGRCINTVGSFSCQCPVGYTRSRCELDINECLSNPCPNGATCLDQIGKYTCVCHPGQNCTEKDCFAWCKNGGQCVRTESGSHCECANGWTGEDCSENIDDCATAACAVGSSCHDRVASFYCECPPGLTGLLCHLDDACITNPCPQGRNCDTNPINGKAICTCPAGYVGPHCSMEIDECIL
ncbi:neurogenic locus notch homolog protein 1-like [Sardina pilchardus]|uniref:neurogenic locus notch homolog protein 1-like n=1 Tax=Sardina pilchardus TaxID=27697 RepID=UPI002E108B42